MGGYTLLFWHSWRRSSMREPIDLWEAEDELINQRLNWLLTSQSLLFVAYGVLTKYSKLEHLITIIPQIGLLICIFILIGILAAVAAQIYLSRKYGPVGVWWPTTIAGWITAAGLPSSFIYAWIYILAQIY